jgi:hypothetical protein
VLGPGARPRAGPAAGAGYDVVEDIQFGVGVLYS